MAKFHHFDHNRWTAVLIYCNQRNNMPQGPQRGELLPIKKPEKSVIPTYQSETKPATSGVVSGLKTPTQLSPEIKRAYLTEITLQARLALNGSLEPEKLQRMVDETIAAGIPRESVMSVLKSVGVPITEKSATPAETKPQFDSQKPIDGKTYNALSKRFNDITRKLLRERNREKLDRLNGVPIGKILNGPFQGGDTVEARLAYNQISNLLDEIEGSEQPQLKQIKIAQPAAATRTNKTPVTNSLKVDTSKSPTGETEVTREQLQQETYGRLYGDLLTAFAKSPDITKEEFMKRISEYTKELRLAGPNLGRAVGMVNRFCQTRDLVRSVREQYPDDRALFEHTFGFSPQGEVQVIMGTIDIAFHIPNIEDRARANTGSAQREDRTARTAAEVVISRVHDPLLNGLVITLEYNDTPDVLNHARQHVVNDHIMRMRELRDSNNETLDTMSARIRSGDNPETAIFTYLDSLRGTRLRQASDEIVAFFAGGTRPEQIIQALTNQRTSYGERFRGLTPSLENLIVEGTGEVYRPYIIAQGIIMLGEGYDQSIRDCVDAFHILQSNGYSQEQVVGFLATRPPQDWKSFVTNKTITK